MDVLSNRPHFILQYRWYAFYLLWSCHLKPNITAAERFRYLYTEDELRGWVGPVRALAEQAEQVHVLMNNCYRDYLANNRRPVSEPGPTVPDLSWQHA